MRHFTLFLSSPNLPHSADIQLSWRGPSFSGIISGNDAVGPLTLSVFDVQGRLLQQLETREGELFQLSAFQGIAMLTATGRNGSRTFKISN